MSDLTYALWRANARHGSGQEAAVRKLETEVGEL